MAARIADSWRSASLVSYASPSKAHGTTYIYNFFFHTRTVRLDTIKVLFIHQPMH